MNVYDTANRLANEIKESNEYLEYKKLKEQINKDSKLKQKIDEFSKKRYEVQILTVRGGQEEEEKLKGIQEEYMELIKDETVKNYFESEMKFSILIADINRIIGESIKDVIS